MDNKSKGSASYGEESVKQEAFKIYHMQKENNKNFTTINGNSNVTKAHLYQKTSQNLLHDISTDHQLTKSNSETSSILSRPNSHSYTKASNEQGNPKSHHQNDMMITINPYSAHRNIQSASNDRNKVKSQKKNNQSHSKKTRHHSRRQTHPMGKGEQAHTKSIPVTNTSKNGTFSSALSAFNLPRLDMADVQDIISNAIKVIDSIANTCIS